MNKRFQDRLRMLLAGKYSERNPELDQKVKSGKTLTTEDIAHAIGTTKQTISKWQTGTTPKMDMIVRIAQAYNISTDWVVGLDDLPTREGQSGYTPFMEMGIDTDAYNNLMEVKRSSPERYNQLISALNSILHDTELLHNGRPVSIEEATAYNYKTELSFPILRTIAEYLDDTDEKYMFASMHDVAELIQKGVEDSDNKFNELTAFAYEKFFTPKAEVLDAYKLSNVSQALKEYKKACFSGLVISDGKTLALEWPHACGVFDDDKSTSDTTDKDESETE